MAKLKGETVEDDTPQTFMTMRGTKKEMGGFQKKPKNSKEGDSVPKKNPKKTIRESGKMSQAELEGLGTIIGGNKQEDQIQIEKVNLDESDSEEEEAESSGGFFNYLKSFTQKELTQEVLTPVLASMKDHLISRNVASDIAQSICEAVGLKLEGKTHSSLKSKYDRT